MTTIDEIKRRAAQALSPNIFSAAFARGLRSNPTVDELREASELLRQHKMFAVAWHLSDMADDQRDE